jgi:hypothetical protein
MTPEGPREGSYTKEVEKENKDTRREVREETEEWRKLCPLNNFSSWLMITNKFKLSYLRHKK